MNKEIKQKYISLLIKSLTEDIDKWQYIIGIFYKYYIIKLRAGDTEIDFWYITENDEIICNYGQKNMGI